MQYAAPVAHFTINLVLSCSTMLETPYRHKNSCIIQCHVPRLLPVCWDVEPRSHDPKKELIPPPHVIQTTYMSGRDNEHRSGRDNEHRSGRDNEHRSGHSTSLSTSKT